MKLKYPAVDDADSTVLDAADCCGYNCFVNAVIPLSPSFVIIHYAALIFLFPSEGNLIMIGSPCRNAGFWNATKKDYPQIALTLLNVN